MLLRLLVVICAPLCEPAELLLKVSPSPPVEGNPMTLTCESQPLWQEPPVQFRFFQRYRALQQGWNKSSQLQVTAVWKKDPEVYWCAARTAASRQIKSRPVWIRVQRIPVHHVHLETQPPGGRVVEGETLVLVCSVTRATGDITFLWYRGPLGVNLRTETQRSLTTKLEIPAVRESDADQYYCTADNGSGPRISGLVNITVTIPASRPVLTLTAPRALVGDTVELRCEAQRGSPPILYRFYCNDVALGSSSAPSGGGVSFNLTLTAEHSGNYSCEADNGLGAQRSAAVPLTVTAPTEDRKELTSVVIEGLSGVLGLVTVVLLFCCWLKRKLGQPSARDPDRPPLPPRPETTYLNTTAPEQRRPIYENVNVVRGDEVYSLAYCVHQEWQPATEPPRTSANVQDPSVIYSGVRRTATMDVDYENDT